jgi:hypothetical protein
MRFAPQSSVCAIRNTHAQYAMHFAPQSSNTQYGYAIRNALRTPKLEYAIRMRNTQCATHPKARIRNTDAQYAIRYAPQSLPKTHMRNTDTQYAIQSSPQSSNTQYAHTIRNALYTSKLASAIHIRNTQYTIRDTLFPPKPSYGQGFLAVSPTTHSIHNTQCAAPSKIVLRCASV